MENEVNTIKSWGSIYLYLTLGIGIIEIFLGLAYTVIWFAIGVGTLFIASIYAFVLYIINAYIKSQSIIVEQNKEIIKLLSK